jgi:hypothetical protein
MAALPSGTVTMLFSDIEGSTRLLTRLGAEYADALSAQRAVLRLTLPDALALAASRADDVAVSGTGLNPT